MLGRGRWPIEGWSASTTTRPPRPPGWPTGSVACSLRSPPPYGARPRPAGAAEGGPGAARQVGAGRARLRGPDPARSRRWVIVPDRRCRRRSTAGHFAASAGLAAVTCRSETSIRGEHRSGRGTWTSNGSCSCPRSRPCARPDQPRLLRPQASRGREAQRRPHLPGPAPLRRPARHARMPADRPAQTSRRNLTQGILPRQAPALSRPRYGATAASSSTASTSGELVAELE
jgi:hypothetical protein